MGCPYINPVICLLCGDKNGGTQAPRASFASSTLPLNRPKFQQLLQLSAVTSDRFVKRQEMEATFGYQRINTMLFIIIIVIPIGLGSTIPYIPLTTRVLCILICSSFLSSFSGPLVKKTDCNHRKNCKIFDI